MLLHEDVINHIYSFLPVLSPSRRDLYLDLNKQILLNKWCRFYSQIYSKNPSSDDYFFNWLDNDIGRWCNDDVPLIHEVTSKYLNVVNQISNCTSALDSIFKMYTEHSSRTLVKKYFQVLSLPEIREIDHFLEVINSNNAINLGIGFLNV